MPSATRRADDGFQWYRDRHRFNQVLDQHIAATDGLNEAERIAMIETNLEEEFDEDEARDFGTWSRWFAISERLRRYEAPRPGRSRPPPPQDPPPAQEQAPEQPAARRPAPQDPPPPAAEEIPADPPAAKPKAEPEKQTRVVKRKAPEQPRGRKLNSRLQRRRSKKRRLRDGRS